MYASIASHVHDKNDNEGMDFLRVIRERNEREKKKLEQYQFTAEIVHLQYMVLFDLAKRKLPFLYPTLNKHNITSYKDSLYEDSDTHICNRACNFFNLKENVLFLHPLSGETIKATGLVYVCVTSGIEHVCGSRCNKKEMTARSENNVCMITGRCFSAAIQEHPFDKWTQVKVKNEPSQNNKIVFYLTDDPDSFIESTVAVEDDRTTSTLESIRIQEKSAHVEKTNKVLANNKRLFQEIKTRNENANQGFFYVEDNIPENNTKRRKKNVYDKKQMESKLNASNLKIIRNLVRNVLYAPNKRQIVDSIQKNRKNDIDSHVCKYIEGCKEQQTMPLGCNIFAIYMSHMSSSYKTLSPIILNHHEDSTIIDYYTKCINVLWCIIYSSDKKSKNKLNFNKVVVSFLYMLMEGYSVKIYVNKENQLVKKYNQITDSENPVVNCEAKEFALIPIHEQLNSLLVPSSHVKSIQKNGLKKSRPAAKSFMKNISVINGMGTIKNSYENILDKLCEEKVDQEKLKQYMLSSYINFAPDC